LETTGAAFFFAKRMGHWTFFAWRHWHTALPQQVFGFDDNPAFARRR